MGDRPTPGVTPTVVLLHGVQSSRRSWWRVAPRLEADGWRVRAVDLLGHGDRAGEGAAELRIDDLARDVLSCVAGPVDLVVGHSLGAIVGLTALPLDPSWARAIVLEDPPGLAGPLDPFQVALDVERAVRTARADPQACASALLAENPRWSAGDADGAVQSRTRLDVGRVTGLLRADRWDLPDLVARCPVPVLLLAAAHDSALVDPDRSAVAGLLPPGRTVVVDSGHSIHRDRPEGWLAEVARFAGSVLSGPDAG